MKITGHPNDIISLIRNGRRYTEISKDYDMTVIPKRQNENEIRRICELIQDGKRNKEISEITGCHFDYISGIRNRNINKDISKEYIFPTVMKRQNENEIRQICELIQDGKRNKEISEITGYSDAVVSKVRNGRSYIDISKDYDLTVIPNQKYKDIVHEICKLIQDGMSNNTIHGLTGFHKSRISEIRNHIIYKDISKDYNFPSNHK